MNNRETSHVGETKNPQFFYGYFIVLAAFLIILAMWGTLYSFGVFFKPLLGELGWTKAMTSGAFSLQMVLHGFLAIMAGMLTDKFGPRIVLTVCGFLLGLGYLLMSQIGAVWQLYLFYGVIIAGGMGGGFVPLVSTVARWFVKRRGLVTGIVVSGIGLGTVIIPLAASQLISSYGWRTSYIIVGIIALVVIMLAAQFLRRDPQGMGQLPYGGGEMERGSLNLEDGGFSFQEAIHTRQFWVLCAVYFCFMFCVYTIMVHTTPHAIELGISSVSAASILSVVGGASIIGRIMLGSVADRIGNKLTITIALILMSLALFWLLVAGDLWTLYLFAGVFGIAYGALSALVSPMTAQLFGLSSHGIILGSQGFIGLIGASVGPVMAGRIYDVTGSYNLAFLILAVVSVIAIGLMLLLGPTTREGGANDS